MATTEITTIPDIDSSIKINAVSNETILFTEDHVRIALLLYVLPIIIIVGTVGNILSVIVLFYSRMHNTSVYFYLIILACADTTVLYISGLKTWIRELTGFELMHVSLPVCQLISFLLLVAFNMAAWILVLITLDRFIAVWFPLRATTMCTLTRSVVAVIALFVVVVVVNIHIFFTTVLGRFGCQQKTTVKGLIYYNTFKLFSYCILPFIAILILNITIIIRLRFTTPTLNGRMTRGAIPNAASAVSTDGTSLCNMNGGSHSQRSQNNSFHSQTRVTYMLLTVSFTWLLLTGPFSLFSLIFQWMPAENSHQRAVYHLIKVIVFLLYYTNHSVNFFLYCITGNKFRHKLAELVFRCCRRRRYGFGSAYSPSVKTARSNCGIELELQDRQTSIRRNYSTIKNADSTVRTAV